MRCAAALVVAPAFAAGCATAALPVPDNPADASVDSADASYVARRTTEQARLAARYAADREVLDHARGTVRRFEEDDARREAFFADLARRRRQQAEATVHTAAARRHALEAALDPSDQLVQRPDGVLFRIPAEQLFLPGTSLLRTGADARLRALGYALGLGPPCDVRIQVLDDAEGFRTDAAHLARRRYARVHDALVAAGVPHAAFLAPLPAAPYGTQIDLLVREQPVPLPP